MAIWPAAVAASLDLLTAVNNTRVTLTVDAGIGDTTLTVDDASQLPASGYVTFDDNATSPETIYYTGRSTNNLTGVTRAADGTTAAIHSSSGGATHLEQRWNAAYHNTLKTEVIAIEQNLSDRIGVDAGSHVLLGVNGAVGAPTYSFASSPTTGLYRVGADDIAFANAGVKTIEFNTTNQVVIPKTTNQLILGTTNTVTISSTAPSASRTYTIPDAGGAASFVMTAGAQTMTGTLTFSGATIAMGANKITGLANGTASTDAATFGQIYYGFQAPVQGTLSSAFTTTSSTFQATGLKATIVPTNSAHRIKISVSATIFCANGATANVILTIKRASTDIGPFSTQDVVLAASSETHVAIAYIDSPATTSSILYEVYIKNTGNVVTVGISAGNEVGSIILEEIV